MFWLEKKYINLLSPRLLRFKWKSTNLANCRCPLCHDSKTSERKARGYFYEKDGHYQFHCHNCNITLSIPNLLKEIDSRLYFEFNKEKMVDAKPEHFAEWKTPAPVFRLDDAKKLLQSIPLLSHLTEEHPARKYFLERKIPMQYFEKFRWCDSFKHWTNLLIPGKFENTHFDHGRMIIPYFDRYDNFFAYTGRVINDNSLRYIKIVLNSSAPHVFGLDTVNSSKDVYVFEGEIDSCFIPNAMACGGQNLNQLTSVAPPERIIVILDNEPHSKETKNKIKTAINHGFRVCIWPSTIEEKDVNKMILRGYSPDYIKNVIDENSYDGLIAHSKLAEWSKV